MVQVALGAVVREALSVAANYGLPDLHHFYVTFATDHPLVQIPDYLREQYMDEMTIVLQHEFWDLTVDDTRFAVTLCFDDINERLVIPFESIISFVDPSVKFGLQFSPEYTALEPGEEDTQAPITPAVDENGNPVSNVVTLDTFRKKP
ncbi:hypothetical protein EQU50_05455 [Candidatus Finniella inopinata]|uniref:Stringent starvation protein B n=2 Tax=Candidatus Finniella inopinata TaxID=1696036 RepID=A0A4Q7DH03_9PROT|nr:hypothetical protein EQU50_05455 [Candidatus Finniella inopinata]